MEAKRFFSQNPTGIVGIVLVTLILAIAGMYFGLYAPKTAELASARQQAEAAAAEAERERQRAAALESEVVQYRAEIEDLENLLASVQETSAVLAASLREREVELEQTQQIQTDLIDALQLEITSGQIRVERMLDSLRVDLVNEILFDSGAATLKPAGVEVLLRLGEVLEGTTDKLIVVQGHTDSVQIGSRLAQTFPTNWELSAARAVNVTRFLQERVGIDPQRLSATGFSEYRPRQDNTTPQGRQQNRRIEILLAPLPETSFAQPVPNLDDP